MRKKYLRNNYLGLLGYAMILLGIASGGVWLVILATSNSTSAAAPGILALVLLACGGAMLAVMAIKGRQDPLEPAAVDADTILEEDDARGRGRRPT